MNLRAGPKWQLFARTTLCGHASLYQMLTQLTTTEALIGEAKPNQAIGRKEDQPPMHRFNLIGSFYFLRYKPYSTVPHIDSNMHMEHSNVVVG